MKIDRLFDLCYATKERCLNFHQECIVKFTTLIFSDNLVNLRTEISISTALFHYSYIIAHTHSVKSPFQSPTEIFNPKLRFKSPNFYLYPISIPF